MAKRSGISTEQRDRYSDCMPGLSQDEQQSLRLDLEARGILVPVEVDPDGNVLDGRHRVLIWNSSPKLRKKTPKLSTVTVDLPTDEERLAHVFKVNMGRRSLSSDQKRQVREKQIELARQMREPKEGRPAFSQAVIAERLGVPRPTITKWLTIDVQANNCCELPRTDVKIPRTEWPTILERFEAGETQEAISDDYKVSQQRIGKIVGMQQKRSSDEEAEPITGTYRIIYADPPWKYADAREDLGADQYGPAERHYKVLSIKELCDLQVGNERKVKDIAQKNAVLFLWTTSPLLEDAFKVINAWDFQYKASFVWDKVKHNYGHYNSVRHEFLLIATRGSCTPDDAKLFDSVQTIERTAKHSEKPDEFRKIIDQLYPKGARIELFAREKKKGWTTHGDQL